MPQLKKSIYKAVIPLLIFLIFIYMLLPWSGSAACHLSQEVFRKGAGWLLNYQTRTYDALEGESFIVKYRTKDKEMAPFVLEMAEKFYDQVQRRLGHSIEQKDKTLLVIYPNESSLKKGFGWEGDKSAVGVYWAGQIRILSPWDWLKGNNLEEVRQAFLKENPLAHEITHLLVDVQTGGNYTRWLTEGLAQYLERELTGYVLDEPAAEEKNNPYPLKSLEENFEDPRRQTGAYWQALHTVDYLIEHYGMGYMREFLNRLGWGEDFEKALTGVYRLNLRELDTIMAEIYANNL